MVAPLKVGIAGLGTVGSAVVRLIEQQRGALSARCGRGVRVVAVAARSKAKKRDVDLTDIAWAKDALALANDPGIDCFVELMGGADDPARSAIEAALKSGKSVVTANKALIAKHGLRLASLAEQHGGALNYEAAVGAAIPVIKTLREGLAGTAINRDIAQKLSILASLAFGTRIAQSAVYVEGISSIAPEDLRAAEELGYRVKLLGVAVRTSKGIEQRVRPTMVPKTSSIAQVMGVTNAVTIDGDGIAPLTLVGPGAGGAATASAVVADIADVASGTRALPFGRPSAKLHETKKAPMERHEGGYYIRLMARDFAGTAATIATRLAEQKISIESIVQRHPNGKLDTDESDTPMSPVPVLLITYATSEDAVHRALHAVRADKVITGRPQVIRIEKN